MMFRGKHPYRALEKAIGYRFRRRSLLRAALTHRSYRFESAGVASDNQRLEFLGDAVLGLLTAEYFFAVFQEEDEGVLTTLRSRVASGKALAELARRIELGAFLRVGKGEEASGGRERRSNLADALESVLGAVYLDGGMKGAEKVFTRLFVPLIESLGDDMWEGNPKGKLQELTQTRWKTSPVYRLAGKKGPAHATVFSVEVDVSGRVLGRGTGRSKQQAERQAAQEALQAIEG